MNEANKPTYKQTKNQRRKYREKKQPKSKETRKQIMKKKKHRSAYGSDMGRVVAGKQRRGKVTLEKVPDLQCPEEKGQMRTLYGEARKRKNKTNKQNKHKHKNLEKVVELNLSSSKL